MLQESCGGIGELWGTGQLRWYKRVTVVKESSGGTGEFWWYRRLAVVHYSCGGTGELRWYIRVAVVQESYGATCVFYKFRAS